MIDIQSEETFSLTQAAKLECLPRRRGGKRPSVSTLWRRVLHGVHGVKLESIVCGGVICTSPQAIQRFFDNLTALNRTTPPAVRSAVKRQRAVEQAIAELEREGV
jgi:hypothetical protein